MSDADEAAQRVAQLFPAIYLRLHRRRPRGGLRPDGQMLATLQHLRGSGPLTVGEAARHLQRAQSVVSELFDRLEAQGLVERMTDERDRRRVLVWLTPRAHELLAREEEVLSPERLRAAIAHMSVADRRRLVEGMEALVEAADHASARTARKEAGR